MVPETMQKYLVSVCVCLCGGRERMRWGNINCSFNIIKNIKLILTYSESDQASTPWISATVLLYWFTSVTSTPHFTDHLNMQTRWSPPELMIRSFHILMPTKYKKKKLNVWYFSDKVNTEYLYTNCTVMIPLHLYLISTAVLYQHKNKLYKFSWTSFAI